MRSNDYSREVSLGRARTQRSARRRSSKAVAVALSLALLAGAGVGGTVAWLTAQADEVVNTFEAASVPNVPVEQFDGEEKTSIVVKNEGNVDAYVRVKLVTYRVDDGGNHIGGAAAIPSFTLGNGWFEKDGYYYYESPVKPGMASGELLGTSIELKQYTDADGGKQVVEVISESIQSLPASAVEDAWKVVEVGSDGKTLTIKTTA